MLFIPLEGKSLLHRMDERLLFGSYLLYQLILVGVSTIPLIIAFVLLLLVARGLGVTVSRFFAAAGRLLLVLLFFAAVPPITALLTGEAAVPPLERSTLLLLRLVALLLSAHLMLGILSPGGVSRTLRWATRPLGNRGRTFSTILVALFALLPRLEEILKEHSVAKRLRGAGLGGPLRRSRITLYALLREGVLEADTLTEAFILRGFHVFDEREKITFRSGRGEWWPPLLLLLFLTASLALPLFGI